MKATLTFTVDNLPGGAIKRLTEAVIYVSSYCESDSAFGLTRLNKILFEADFESFFTRGVPITGASYQRLQYGPVPKAMPHRLRELQDRGEIHIREVDYLGLAQKKPIALRSPDISMFNAGDMALLHHAIRDSWGKTAVEVSDASHRIEWRTRENRDPIPYEASWLSNDAPTWKEIERTKELAEKYGW